MSSDAASSIIQLSSSRALLHIDEATFMLRLRWIIQTAVTRRRISIAAGAAAAAATAATDIAAGTAVSVPQQDELHDRFRDAFRNGGLGFNALHELTNFRRAAITAAIEALAADYEPPQDPG